VLLRARAARHGDIVHMRRKKGKGPGSWVGSQVGKIVGLNAIFLNVFILIGSVFESSSMHLLLQRTCYCTGVTGTVTTEHSHMVGTRRF
jgi:hypothetical protein